MRGLSKRFGRLVLILICTFSTASVFATDHLVSEWTFDSGSATDSSGNGNNGIIHGTPSVVSGVQGNALHLGGSDFIDYVNDQYFPQVTASAFMRLDAPLATSSGAPLIDGFKGRENFQLGLINQGGKDYLTAGFHDSPSPLGQYPEVHVTSSTPVNAGQFYHVALTYDGNILKLFLNGKMQGQIQTPKDQNPFPVIADASPDIRVGIDRDGRTFKGALDDFQLYNSALSAPEIAEIAKPVVPQKIVLAWGKDVPVRISRTRFGNQYSVSEIGEGSMGAATLSLADRDAIQSEVQNIFERSGIRNVEITNVPDPEATTVYFTPLPDDPNWTLGGKAYTGNDRYNKHREGAAAVFVRPITDQNRAFEIADDAHTIAHEVGHTFGLRHVNPAKSADPFDQEVMDYNFSEGTPEKFINAVTDGFDSDKPQHNPVYHLLRYVDGMSSNELTAQGINPGAWDLPEEASPNRIRTFFGIDATNLLLYNVVLSTGSGDADSLVTLAHFDAITSTDLSRTAFDFSPDERFQLVASSAPGAMSDILLATGDPFDSANSLIEPKDGFASAYLQQYVLTGSHYVTLSGVTVEGTLVPEPSIIVAISAMVMVSVRLRRDSSVAGDVAVS